MHSASEQANKLLQTRLPFFYVLFIRLPPAATLIVRRSQCVEGGRTAAEDRPTPCITSSFWWNVAEMR